MNHETDTWEDHGSKFTYPAYKDWRNVDYIPTVGLVPLDSDDIVMTTSTLGKKPF